MHTFIADISGAPKLSTRCDMHTLMTSSKKSNLLIRTMCQTGVKSEGALNATVKCPDFGHPMASRTAL